MSVVNTDSNSHSAKIPDNCLHKLERGKKRVYLEACLQQRRHFSPFVVSVDGLMGVEAKFNLEKVSQSPGHQVAETLL